MPNKYKVEAIVIDTDDEDPLGIEDIKSDLTGQITELYLDIEGEIKVTKIEGD